MLMVRVEDLSFTDHAVEGPCFPTRGYPRPALDKEPRESMVAIVTIRRGWRNKVVTKAQSMNLFFPPR